MKPPREGKWTLGRSKYNADSLSLLNLKALNIGSGNAGDGGSANSGSALGGDGGCLI